MILRKSTSSSRVMDNHITTSWRFRYRRSSITAQYFGRNTTLFYIIRRANRHWTVKRQNIASGAKRAPVLCYKLVDFLSLFRNS